MWAVCVCVSDVAVRREVGGVGLCGQYLKGGGRAIAAGAAAVCECLWACQHEHGCGMGSINHRLVHICSNIRQLQCCT